MQLMLLGERPCRGQPIALHVFGRDAHQPRHLARMRRDDHVVAITAGEQARVFPCEGIQRIGIEHDRHAHPLHHAVHEGAYAATGTEAGAHRDDVARCVQDAFDRVGRDLSVGILGQADGHVLGGHGGEDGLHGSRRGDGDQAGARPHRRHRCQVRGAALAHRSRDDQDAPELALVRLRVARLEHRAHHAARDHLDVGAVESLDDRFRDADVGDDQFTADALRRRQDVADLRRCQRHGDRGPNRLALHLVRVGQQAARDVHGDHREAAAVQVADDGRIHAVERLPQARPEDGIDHQVALRDLGEVQFPGLLVGDLDHRRAESPEHFEVVPRITAHVRQRTDHEHRHLDDPFEQRARDDEAVAAVVAASGQDRHPPHRQVREQRLDGRHHLATGVLHQHE